MTQGGEARFRALRPEDLQRVVDIDALITGRRRGRFFEKRLEAALAYPKGFATVAAEIGEGRLVGFAIARIQEGEFGVDRKTAVIDVIGVDPCLGKQGLGRALLQALEAKLAAHEVSELRTQVDWNNRAMLGFLAGAGFAMAHRPVLECATSARD